MDLRPSSRPAIRQLLDGISKGYRPQVLLGASGTAKTFTITPGPYELNRDNQGVDSMRKAIDETNRDLRALLADESDLPPWKKARRLAGEVDAK